MIIYVEQKQRNNNDDDDAINDWQYQIQYTSQNRN